MDPEVLRLMAHIDQTRAELKAAVLAMPPDDLINLFRDCATGRLAGMDEPTLLRVGMLAAMAIYDICQCRIEEDHWTPPGPACPQCGEDDLDHLVWIDDDQVRCDKCGTVYTP
jgi:hypothetical protein